MARRTYQLQNTGLEVFFPGRSSLYLTLKSAHAREDLRSCLQAQPGLRMRQQRSPAMWRRDWCLGKACCPAVLRSAGWSPNGCMLPDACCQGGAGLPWLCADAACFDVSVMTLHV